MGRKHLKSDEGNTEKKRKETFCKKIRRKHSKNKEKITEKEKGNSEMRKETLK